MIRSGLPSPLLLVLLFLPQLTACDPALAPERNIEIDLARSAYELDAGRVTVGFTVRNVGDGTFYLDRCGPHLATSIDRSESGIWVRHSIGQFCTLQYVTSPLALHPGEEIQGTRGLPEPEAGRRYRIRISVRTAPQSPSRSVPSQSSFRVE